MRTSTGALVALFLLSAMGTAAAAQEETTSLDETYLRYLDDSGISGNFFQVLQFTYRPNSFSEKVGLYFVDKYKEGTDLLVITPGTFKTPNRIRKLPERLLGNKEFAEKYSVAFAFYPMGMDPEKSARLITEDLKKVQSRLGFQKATLAGFSLGGLVNKMIVSDDKLYDQVPFVDKAIFVSTPFEGTASPIGHQVWGLAGPLYPSTLKKINAGSSFIKKLQGMRPKVPVYILAGEGEHPDTASLKPLDWLKNPFQQGGAFIVDRAIEFNQLAFREKKFGLPLGKTIPNDGTLSVETQTGQPDARVVRVLQGVHHSQMLHRWETAQFIREATLGKYIGSFRPVKDTSGSFLWAPNPKTWMTSWGVGSGLITGGSMLGSRLLTGSFGPGLRGGLALTAALIAFDIAFTNRGKIGSGIQSIYNNTLGRIPFLPGGGTSSKPMNEGIKFRTEQIIPDLGIRY